MAKPLNILNNGRNKAPLGLLNNGRNKAPMVSKDENASPLDLLNNGRNKKAFDLTKNQVNKSDISRIRAAQKHDMPAMTGGSFGKMIKG